MILWCPVCESRLYDAVLEFENVPIFQLLNVDEHATPEYFAPLDIVRCQACGHLYNRAYSEELGKRMYRGEVLSNVPVNFSMTRNLESIADWIGHNQFAGRAVVEVGAGSGHLARILAREAKSVMVFEPSIGLRPEMFPEENIDLINRDFSAAAVSSRADLIVCRQVLEHLADPLTFLREVGHVLRGDGRLYLEVPRAEYIEDHAALFDFHYAHVQYFHESNLLRLIAKAEFMVERSWLLKEGHDVGMLLRPHRGVDMRPVAALNSGRLAADLEHRHAEGRELLTSLPGDVVLYGATWHGVAFLNAYQLERQFAVAFDDNVDYAGYALYSSAQKIPVSEPDIGLLLSVNTVVITAYLHDRVIATKLRDIGFRGRIVSTRACGTQWSAFLP